MIHESRSYDLMDNILRVEQIIQFAFNEGKKVGKRSKVKKRTSKPQ